MPKNNYDAKMGRYYFTTINKGERELSPVKDWAASGCNSGLKGISVIAWE